MIRFSKSTGWFYGPSGYGENVPADVVEISPERHAELISGLSFGKRIVGDENGYPVLVEVNQSKTTSLSFMERFTDAEQLSIVTATMRNAQIKLLYDKLIAATEIVYADPRLLAGLQEMVSAGLITLNRMDEILPPEWR